MGIRRRQITRNTQKKRQLENEGAKQRRHLPHVSLALPAKIGCDKPLPCPDALRRKGPGKNRPDFHLSKQGTNITTYVRGPITDQRDLSRPSSAHLGSAGLLPSKYRNGTNSNPDNTGGGGASCRGQATQDVQTIAPTVRNNLKH